MRICSTKRPVTIALQVRPPSVDLLMPPDSAMQSMKHETACAMYNVFESSGSMAMPHGLPITGSETWYRLQVAPPSAERYTSTSMKSRIRTVTRLGALRSTMTFATSTLGEYRRTAFQVAPPFVDLTMLSIE